MESGVTFAVDDVVPTQKPFKAESMMDSLNRRFKRKILVLPEADLLVIDTHSNSRMQTARIFARARGSKPFTSDAESQNEREYLANIGSRAHPFMDAVHSSFSLHLPLVISPDDIWLIIAQGFSHHLTENAEALRSRLVRHQGRRNLEASIRTLDPANFDQAIAMFSKQIRAQTNPVLHETLICDFTTTTPASRVASEVALMDTFSSYFSYTLMCICGIPKITIQGSLEDWEKIRQRIEVLGTYELEWWVSRLRPILDEFVLAAKGQANPDFWKAIYKPGSAYATTLVTGWIADLFPYLGNSPQRVRNDALTIPRTHWALPVSTGVPWKFIPNGLSSVSVKLFIHDVPSELDLVAGFLAVKQDSSDLSLSNVIGWSVTEPAPKTPIVLQS